MDEKWIYLGVGLFFGFLIGVFFAVRRERRKPSIVGTGSKNGDEWSDFIFDSSEAGAPENRNSNDFF